MSSRWVKKGGAVMGWRGGGGGWWRGERRMVALEKAAGLALKIRHGKGI